MILAYMNMTAKVVILLIGDKMAQRQNTFNQFPSNDLADLNDNTIIVDEFTNSQDDYTLDRFGRQFKTLHKIVTDINKLSDEIRVGALPATRSVVNGTPIYTVGVHVVTNDNIGEFRLMPFRANELPFGWYFRNGDNYLLHSPQWQALNRLSDNYKRDHRITIKEIDGQQYINVPSAFASDGRGFFERAVDGATRQVGSGQGDAIRNLYGEIHHLFHWRDTVPTGVFKKHLNNDGTGLNNRYYPITCSEQNSDYPEQTVVFDAAQFTLTANENRPLNIGLTPTIYLGV